jgi:hypothetical protein
VINARVACNVQPGVQRKPQRVERRAHAPTTPVAQAARDRRRLRQRAPRARVQRGIYYDYCSYLRDRRRRGSAARRARTGRAGVAFQLQVGDLVLCLLVLLALRARQLRCGGGAAHSEHSSPHNLPRAVPCCTVLRCGGVCVATCLRQEVLRDEVDDERNHGEVPKGNGTSEYHDQMISGLPRSCGRPVGVREACGELQNQRIEVERAEQPLLLQCSAVPDTVPCRIPLRTCVRAARCMWAMMTVP